MKLEVPYICFFSCMYHLWGTITIHHLFMSIQEHNLDYVLSIVSREKVMDINDAWKKVDVYILSWKFQGHFYFFSSGTHKSEILHFPISHDLMTGLKQSSMLLGLLYWFETIFLITLFLIILYHSIQLIYPFLLLLFKLHFIFWVHLTKNKYYWY